MIDGAARFPGKWSVMAMWWGIQALLIWMATAVMSWQTYSVDGPNGFAMGLRKWNTLPGQLIRQDVLVSSIILGVSIALVQWFVLLPVRRPEMGEGGKSLKVTIVLAGGMIGALLVAAGFAITSLFELLLKQRLPFEIGRISTIASAAVAWIGAGTALWIWVRRARDLLPNVLSRLMERLFKGTVIEVAAILPIDYMVRRKSDCYCGEGTFWALIVAGVVGTIAFGPMVWLPLIAKRRREWYGGHCRACGYDMQATPGALRCPECGTGWKETEPHTHPST